MFALTIGKYFLHDFLRGQFPNKNFKHFSEFVVPNIPIFGPPGVVRPAVRKTEVVPATNNEEPPKHLTPYALGGTTDNNMPNDLTTTPPINPPDVENP